MKWPILSTLLISLGSSAHPNVRLGKMFGDWWRFRMWKRKHYKVNYIDVLKMCLVLFICQFRALIPANTHEIFRCTLREEILTRSNSGEFGELSKKFAKFAKISSRQI